MSIEDAYVEGFRKQASDMGVDPAALVKFASSGTSEVLGSLVASLIPTTIGGLIGHHYGDVPGAIIGATGGNVLAGIANLIGYGMAADKKRTREEQELHDQDPHVDDFLIPGMASYNHSLRAKLRLAEALAASRGKI